MHYYLKKFASVASDFNDFDFEISFEQNIATASKIPEKTAQYTLFHDPAWV